MFTNHVSPCYFESNLFPRTAGCHDATVAHLVLVLSGT
uniref:Uncharacterized protein n=1 Tax=Triticum urartu TaxID=4572 RepID=A0A8R7UFT5_TRIUA